MEIVSAICEFVVLTTALLVVLAILAANYMKNKEN